MREARKIQYSLRENWLDLDHAKELQAMSRLLDSHPKVAELVLQDLRPCGTRVDWGWLPSPALPYRATKKAAPAGRVHLRGAIDCVQSGY
jgi:hypothetical protein